MMNPLNHLEVGVPRILVIDDEAQMRYMLREMLEDAGYEVLDAARSDDGVETFRRTPVDLVITDLFMPPKGGLEVIRELQSDDPKVKIIAISGMGVQDRVDLDILAKQSGAVRAFRKPFGREELLGAIRELIGGSDTAS